MLELLDQPVVHADETVVQVLHEPNKKAKTDSRMWLYCSDSSADRNTVNASPGAKLSKAVNYALNEKKNLYRFLGSPYVSRDNNRAENAIRPFVVGRKNWLFSNKQNGTTASVLIYSLAVTACANGLNVEYYFFRLLTSDGSVSLGMNDRADLSPPLILFGGYGKSIKQLTVIDIM